MEDLSSWRFAACRLIFPSPFLRAMDGEPGGKPKCYLIVHSVAKKNNLGTLARSACAFNVHEVSGKPRNRTTSLDPSSFAQEC